MMNLEQLVNTSFTGEIKAFKPGNVSDYSAGHDMTAEDFYRSAELTTPLICRTEWGLGKRIYTAVQATREAVGCNTNLGMLILFTPLVMAAETGFDDVSSLQQKLQQVLSSLSQEDTFELFEAITLASPGGLGKVEKSDVSEKPDCSVLEAMQLASERDYVALQYVNNFTEVFEQGLSTIKGFVKRWNSVEWAVVACYLNFLSTLRDSHIERKYGKQQAEIIKKQSGEIYKAFIKLEKPEQAIDLLEEFDEQLKEKKINPGTSADLAATSLLVYNLTHKKE